jgi:hypothetical protein
MEREELALRATLAQLRGESGEPVKALKSRSSLHINTGGKTAKSANGGESTSGEADGVNPLLPPRSPGGKQRSKGSDPT